MAVKASVVYLTKNGGDLFKDSLRAVLSQQAEFEYEVVAVDSGSSDGTLETLTAHPVVLHQVEPKEFNFGRTRDYGFEVAQGEIVVVISQDSVPVGTDWLANLMAPFDDPQVAVVQAMDVLPEWSDEELFFWEKVRKFYYTRDCKMWMENNNNIGLSFTCCAIRRSVWKEHPLGTVEMSEDKVFQQRVAQAGHKIVFQDKARSAHTHMYTVTSLAKRCENEGLGWRNVGVHYGFSDMIADMTNGEIWQTLREGLAKSEVKRIAEVLFPFIRPFFIYKGNKFTRSYVK
ncbi:glycosyltransferase family 2 protein [Geomonas propionica]|uniref:Glycosyltransferase family 2 protein n=1 Tax=Geomonas propionica TaxID=2798582 RepID=A0ABS0YSX4_9BACT|nr:glycosyltransferase [Geomonas propionica]MBJ6801033.1 glycosyltransferase family 2 protein [Geomonas propionica]